MHCVIALRHRMTSSGLVKRKTPHSHTLRRKRNTLCRSYQLAERRVCSLASSHRTCLLFTCVCYAAKEGDPSSRAPRDSISSLNRTHVLKSIPEKSGVSTLPPSYLNLCTRTSHVHTDTNRGYKRAAVQSTWLVPLKILSCNSLK